MKKSIFIITEDLDNGVIQSQVLTHIKFLQKNKVSNFLLIVCFWDNMMVSYSKKKSAHYEKLFKIKIRFLKLIAPRILFSNFINRRRLEKYFDQLNDKFDYIHARTDFCAVISNSLKNKNKLQLIWDCRGYAPAEIDYQEKSVFNLLKRELLKIRFRNACIISDKVIVVSSYLESLVKKKNKSVFLIPSTASSDIFYFDKKKREKKRKELNIKNKEIVFVYSGSLKKYQMIDETINFFRSILKTYNKCKLLILTKDIDIAKKKVFGEKQIYVFCLEQKEVNDYLNAADFGIMIRKSDLTNRAASPTKFAEYCLTGLNVITNASVRDYYNMKNQSKNIFDISSFNILSFKRMNREKVSEFYRSRISRESFLEVYKEIYD